MNPFDLVAYLLAGYAIILFVVCLVLIVKDHPPKINRRK
jgi:hypothetical protein